jgi:hypothetical protein
VEQAAEALLLQSKYEEHSRLAQEFKLKLVAVQGSLVENRARIAPISRVPPEVLGEIFAIHVGENQQSPWLLMKVSRAWRATSLLTRDLWRRIMLVPADWFWGRPQSRVFEGMQICMNASQLRSALERAGSLPLDLRIASRLHPSHRSGRFYNHLSDHSLQTTINQKSNLRDLLNAFLKYVKIPRIRSLSISTESFNLAADALDGFSFVDMESLALDFNYLKIIARVVKESLLLQKIHVPSTSMKHLKRLGRWHRVDDLNVAHVCGDRLTDIRSILVAAAHLTSLQFCGDALKGSDEPDAGDLVMPSLKHLSLKHTDPFWPIICPNLTHLTMGPFSEIVPLPDQSVPLPHLIELVFITYFESVGILRGFTVPSLRKLVLKHSRGKAISAKGFKELWPLQFGGTPSKGMSPSDVEPKILHLESFTINPKLLGRTLNERPFIEEIKFDNVAVNAEFFECLVPVRTAKAKGSKGKGKAAPKGKRAAGSKAGWSGGCPELKRLFIDISQFRNKEEQIAAIMASAKTFMAKRLKTGTPLERLAIKLGNYEGWKELVKVEDGL